MLRDRLIELDIKITELADYLDSSRPTIYKYIESFDNDEKNKIPKKIIKLFNLINDSPLIDKLNVIEFIISNKNKKTKRSVENTDVLKTIKKYKTSNPRNEKILFVYNVLSSDVFDFLIPYFNIVFNLKNENMDCENKNDVLEMFNKLKFDIDKLNKEEK